MSITTVSTKNKGKIQPKRVFCHCRTKFNAKEINFVWSITDFWNTYDLINTTLTSSNIEGQLFKIKMCIDKGHQKLRFFIQSTKFNPKDKIDIHKYHVCIQSTKGRVLQTKWKTFHLNTYSLYEVSLRTLRLNKTYLPNNTLSVHFTFQSYDISHSIMHENILETSQTATNDIASDTSNSIVIFTVDGKHLHINKSLLRATSSVINNMLIMYDSKEDENVEIEIIDTTYDILKLVISYIEARSQFELNLATDNYKNILFELISVADQLDVKGLKIMCEKHIIKYITKKNALKYLNFAINSNAEYLANYVKRLIKLHLDDIINTKEFLEKIKNNPQILSDILEQELIEENASYS